MCTDTKGDLFRNYAGIAQKYYGYQTSILDLRNPTCSDGDNILGMVNKYMDLYLENPENLAVKARQRNMQRSQPRPSLVPEAEMPPVMDRTHFSMTQRRGF